MPRQPSCLKTLLRLQAAVYSELLKANTILCGYHTTEEIQCYYLLSLM